MSLSVAQFLLMAITVIAVPLTAFTATGRGGITLRAELDPPYLVGLADGGTMEVDESDWVRTYRDLPNGETAAVFSDGPSVAVDATVARDDTDTRVVVIVGVLLTLAAAWNALVNLRRIVQSAVAGEPFDRRNVRRLQEIGAMLLGAPVLLYLGTHVLNQTLDERSTLTVSHLGPSWWTLVLGGLGALALGEVFRSGFDLRELERSTV